MAAEARRRGCVRRSAVESASRPVDDSTPRPRGLTSHLTQPLSITITRIILTSTPHSDAPTNYSLLYYLKLPNHTLFRNTSINAKCGDDTDDPLSRAGVVGCINDSWSFLNRYLRNWNNTFNSLQLHSYTSWLYDAECNHIFIQCWVICLSNLCGAISSFVSMYSCSFRGRNWYWRSLIKRRWLGLYAIIICRYLGEVIWLLKLR